MSTIASSEPVASPRGRRRPARSSMTKVQVVAAAVGAIFVLVGVLGFVPGVTQHYDELSFAGRESGADLVGLFQTSILHNAVHLLFGAVGLFLARRGEGPATAFLTVGGLVYLVLALFGLAIDLESAANFVPLNDADNALHMALGGIMILAGVITPAISAKK